MKVIRRGRPPERPKVLTRYQCECPRCKSLLEYTEKDIEDTEYYWWGIPRQVTPRIRCLECFCFFPRRWYHRWYDKVRYNLGPVRPIS